jgi:hypothetical protein
MTLLVTISTFVIEECVIKITKIQKYLIFSKSVNFSFCIYLITNMIPNLCCYTLKELNICENLYIFEKDTNGKLKRLQIEC